ncbi:MAG: sulfatase-like hydrolase/transferase [Candidatus Koribacter versatilis]|uniref:Sulfatase-like hydrolase/transferase n=1 Tax=Candidatus Korobacter versatilis TaxID=658062 RepID=A0A932EPL8_9BACT|nr:sulfatase-like hydrolase/transferase [Candidatus Koribacter versatilis]
MLARLRILCLLVISSALATAAAGPPNIILITLDTTRADRMGFLGSTRGLTPNLDALARQSVVFEHAYSQAPLTTASHATILTGTYPQYHGVNDFGVPLRADVPSLPDLLHQRGYRTAAFVGSIILDPKSGFAPGFERGFDVYDAGYRIRRGTEDRYTTMERRADEVAARAIAWLNKTSGKQAGKPAPRPFFLWVHLYDPHDPYEAPAPYGPRYKAEPYDGELAYTDAAVGRLLNALRARGLYEGAAVAVMADHGEALGQHGENTHGIFLYDETIRVPLLIKPPAGKARVAPSRVSEAASLVDVAPTLLQLAGIVAPRTMQGAPLPAALPKRAGPGPLTVEERPYAETDYPRRAFGWSPLRAIRSGKYLFVLAPERELYDLAKDPGATNNLAASSSAVADTLANGMSVFRASTSGGDAAKAALTPEQTANLGALGYVAGSSPSGGNEAASGIDPKKKIGVVNLLHDALLDVEGGRYEEAIPRLEKVLAGDPQMFIANMQMGTAWARKKQPANAATWFQKAVTLQPENAMAQYELGLALFATGEWKEAATHFEAAVERSPKWPDAQYSLGSVYARIDRVPEAKEHLLAALALNPELFPANLLYGRILTLQRQPGAGLPYLEKAVASQADSAEAHAFLADALLAAGRKAEALREYNAAKRLMPQR